MNSWQVVQFLPLHLGLDPTYVEIIGDENAA